MIADVNKPSRDLLEPDMMLRAVHSGADALEFLAAWEFPASSPALSCGWLFWFNLFWWCCSAARPSGLSSTWPEHVRIRRQVPPRKDCDLSLVKTSMCFE